MPVEIIGELGINWNGDMLLLSNMMSKAKNADVNAIKLQAFLPEHVKGHPLAKQLIKSSVTKDNAEEIMDLAKANEVEAFVTPFYPEAVDFLNPHVSKWKIREHDSRPLVSTEGSASPVEPTPLIRKVMDTAKPVYMSVQLKPLDNYWAHQGLIHWLYCLPQYPAKLEDLELQKCSYDYGFSCHCPDPLAPIAAATLMLNARDHRSRIIEVHVSEEPKSSYVDGNVSFSFPELTEIVKQIRKLETMKLERTV